MSRYRAGPWPGLTPTGAAMLLACAVFLGVGQVMVGAPKQPLPDLPLVAATALVPLVIGVRIVRTPGAASAICGAYLLPASLVSLLRPSLPPPALLLVPTLIFDLSLWLQPAHVTNLLRRRRLEPSSPRALTATRAAFAGAAFGLSLAVIEPPYRLFLGATPNVWMGQSAPIAAAVAAAVCAALATLLTARGRAA